MNQPNINRRLRLLVSAVLTISVIAVGSLPAVADPAPAPQSQVTTAASYPRPGQRGTAVRKLQNKLIAAGYLKAELNTGYYGSKTKAGVKRAQRAYDLPQTGRLNAATVAAIDKAVAAATGPKTWYHKETIGRSAGGRAIVAYRAGQAGKPVVMVVATMHGEENFGQYAARGLLEGKLIEDVDLWVVPVLNPDGLAKDRRWIKGHVDLNRNFPTGWVRRANSGPRAKSGTETKVIMRFLNRVDPKYLVSWHQPLHAVDSDSAKDEGLMRRLATNLDLPKKPLTCGGACHGTMTMWFNRHHKGAAITIEYGSTARSLARMKGRDADGVLKAIGGKRAA
jgi:peptidoglycan hydrolase-like protein with peptidoglycan-binding domain